MPTLDCYAARLSAATSDAHETRDLQCRLPRGRAARVARISARRPSNGREHDVLTIPHWTWARHEAKGGDADLFMVTDKSAFERLDLVREELQ